MSDLVQADAAYNSVLSRSSGLRAPDAKVASSPPLPDRPLRVLICDDHALTVLRLQRALALLGYQVVGSAAEGSEAVRLVVEMEPDVVLMDVHMPRMSGIEALKQVMEQKPTAVVMLSGYRDGPTIQESLDAGASAYLVKPIRDDQLAPTISLATARFRELQAERAAAQLLADEAKRQASETDRRICELTAELRRQQALARALAESFLCTAPRIPGISIETCYEPASEWQLVGGDYFDFFEVGEGALGIVLGDACGKGLPAAVLTAVARHTLRAYALEDCSPAEVVGRLNRALCRCTVEACPFLTLVYGVLDLSSYRFTYANAGHPAPVLCGSQGSVRRLLETTGGLIGVEPDWVWGEASVVIPEGGALALFSDGITEARVGAKMLGEAGAADALQRGVTEGAANIASLLKDRAHSFVGGLLPDDLVIVVVRRIDPSEARAATTLPDDRVSQRSLAPGRNSLYRPHERFACTCTASAGADGGPISRSCSSWVRAGPGNSGRRASHLACCGRDRRDSSCRRRG